MSTVPPAAVVALLPLLDEPLEQPAAARAAAATTATPHVLAFKFNVLSLSTSRLPERAQLTIPRRAMIRSDQINRVR